MQLNLERAESKNLINRYDEGFIVLNEQRKISQSVLIMPNHTTTEWPPERVEELTEAHFEYIAEWTPEVVILGTGRQLQFPHPRLTRPLMARHIGVEVMDTGAACRTYNILAAEERQVLAALFMI